MIIFGTSQCELGSVLVARSERGIRTILLGDNPISLVRDFQTRFPDAKPSVGDPEFEQLLVRVVEVMETPGLKLDFPLDVQGTVFQQRVWRTLQDIPVGSTASYHEIATRIGQPSAVRAVAQACAANDLAVAIPCHRVVRSDGGLSGYRWGKERKQALLQREGTM
jgi:AraC family transcriptional regulator, regulatory protein of adaptative response / methylated-DNA-[protein]-cysteine methyltransferase